MSAAIQPAAIVPLVEVTIADALTGRAIPGLSAQLDKILDLQPRQVIIDLSRCVLVDAAAIALLLDVHRRLWRADGLLTLRAPTPRLRRLLEVARVDRVLHVIPGPSDPSGLPPAHAYPSGGAGPAGHGRSSPEPAVASPGVGAGRAGDALPEPSTAAKPRGAPAEAVRGRVSMPGNIRPAPSPGR